MLPLDHDPSCRWTKKSHVYESRDKHRCYWEKDMKPVLLSHNSTHTGDRSTRYCLRTWEGESEYYWKNSLHAKIDREGLLLKGRELRPRKGLKCYNTRDEGLVGLSRD